MKSTNSQITQTVGVIRSGSIRYPISRQRRACLEAGAETVIEIGKDAPLKLIARDWTTGQRVCVQWLWLVAPYGKPSREKRHAVLTFVDLVTEHGGEVYEIGSGWSSLDPDERRAMLADAMDAVTRWRVKTGRPPGRPKRKPEKDDEAYRIWHNMKHYPTYADCERAWGGRKAWGTWQKAYRLWGKRTN